ncbi:hypothetical protein [Nodosilinea nodulosa]|uniref:hypothetical protein n=1 Tax=Nodosilinea nodulosa TaxID=416001 RepID=UPI00031CEE0A|nr:hypothetical protein [Nodosilinea nodulosa]
MRNRCLPTRLILRNVGLALALVAGGVMLSAEIHASANQQQQKTESLRRMFVYQILVGAEQQH